MDWVTVNTSPMPGGQAMRDVAGRAAEMVGALDAVMMHPVMQLALGRQDADARLARAGLAVAQPPVRPEDAAGQAKARAELAARTMLAHILWKARERWQMAAGHRRNLPPTAAVFGAQAGQKVPPEQSAFAAVRVAQATVELVALPGWTDFQNFIAGVTWGLWFAASVTQGDAHDAHTAAVEMLVGMFEQLQHQVELGVVAETWLKAKAEESGKE